MFSRFGVDPKTWLTNVANEGTTDVDGTETIQIHGDADIEQDRVRPPEDPQQARAARHPAADPDQIDQLQSAVQDASIDVYSSTDDHLLHQAGASSLAIAPPAGAGATVSSVNVDFSVTLSDVNEPQTITAPSNAKPISELLGQLGIPGLRAFGSAARAGSLPGGGSSARRRQQPAPPTRTASQKARAAAETASCATRACSS